MQQIKLKRLSLINFKGIKKLDISFNPETTDISGDNATGKTTVFDAFLWLLFGKDSFDRTSFNIKTLDDKGAVIEKLSHEVTGVILVDGKEITFRRTYNEKWTKKRGTETEEFTGHESTYFVDEVPCTMAEYNQKVSELCAEQHFKLITNPAYFPSQKKEVQRQILISIAGNITDAEIAGNNKKFVEMLAEMSGKTLDEFRRQIGAKKKMVKDQLESIPARIDEVKRNTPQSENWPEIEGQIKANEKEIEQIDGQLRDVSKKQNEENKKRLELLRQVSDLQTKRQQLISDNVIRLSAGHSKSLSEINEIKNQLENKRQEYRRNESEALELSNTIRTDKQAVNGLRDEWKLEFGKQLSFNPEQFVCPTCHREFETDDIEKKKAEMLANFENEKNRIVGMINDRGKRLNAKVEENSSKLIQVNSLIEKLASEIHDLETRLSGLSVPEIVDYNSVARQQPEVVEIDKEIDRLNELASVTNELPKDEALEDRKHQLIGENVLLSQKLALENVIDNNLSRIAELQNEQKKLNQELADLEKKEFTVSEFSKAKITEVEKRINSLFKLVKFKMFDTQVNGGEVETCEATVGGVPYSDLNNAMRINAGLDIVEALSGHHKVFAPIFIDNAESINDILPVQSQLIRLLVTKDKELRVN